MTEFDPEAWSKAVLKWAKESKEFDIYRWSADWERFFGLPLSLWQLMYPVRPGAPIDPKNNRTIRLAPKPVEPSEWQRFRRMITPSRPGPQDVGGCLVGLGLIVGAFLLGRCL